LCGHPTIVFDTEYASEKEWYNAITPLSGLSHPSNLDELREEVHGMLAKLEAAKKAKKKADRVPEETGCFFVVDTITELLPKKIMEQIEKEGIDKMYPIQALWISTWMKEVVKKLRATKSSMVFVMQERKSMNAAPFAKEWKLPGGMSPQYGNHLRVRVTHSGKVKKGVQVVGAQSHYKIENNKIDGTSYEEASLFTSNGRGDLPKGLDLVREAVEEGKASGYIKSGKSDGKSCMKVCVGDLNWAVEGGEEDVRNYLRDDANAFGELVSAMNLAARRQS
jgi:hypothetical protein